MTKQKYAGNADVKIPAKQKGPKGPDTVSCGNNPKEYLGCVSTKPTSYKAKKSGFKDYL